MLGLARKDTGAGTMAAPDARQSVAPGSFALLVLPILLFLAIEYVLKNFGDGSLPLGDIVLIDTPRPVELIGRYKFMAAAAFFASVSLAVMAIFAVDLALNYTRRTAGFALLGLAAGALVGMVFSVLAPGALWNFETYNLVGGAFYETALGVGQVAICEAGRAECDGIGALFTYNTLSDPINALTALGAAAALTGVILALRRADAPAPADQVERLEAEARALSAARAVLQRYLYCAGLLLTAGMTFLISWMHWPAPLIADIEARAAYFDLTGALTLFIGVCYSMLILSVYLPVLLILAARGERYGAALAAADLPEVADTPARFEIPAIGYIDGLKSMTAILSPILASAIGSFAPSILGLGG